MAPSDESTSPFTFPCEFPIKALGRQGDEFVGLVVSMVRRHAPDLGEGAVTLRASGGGKYLAVTITITATSRAQLDAIYQDLTACEQVLWAL